MPQLDCVRPVGIGLLGSAAHVGVACRHLGFAAFLSGCPFCMSTLHTRQDSPLNWTSLRSPLCGTFFCDLLEVGSFTGYSSSGWVMTAKRDEPPCSEGGSSVGITHVPNCYRRTLTSCSLRVYPKAPPRRGVCSGHY